MPPDRWNEVYESEGRRWGDAPGEMARVAVERLLDRTLPQPPAGPILDVGCGYGRDSVFLAQSLNRRVVGIDPAAPGIELARSSAPEGLALEYRNVSIEEIHGERFAAIFASNVYHAMRPAERRALQRVATEALLPGGLFFLSALAVGDPEHWGTGTPIEGDPDSFAGTGYLHYSSPTSVRHEFGALSVERLWQHAFVERLNNGGEHRHLHVMLVARRV